MPRPSARAPISDRHVTFELLGRLLGTLLAALLVGLLGCGRPASDGDASPPSAAAGPLPTSRQRLVVFAASSLTDAFDALERSFEAANADVDVALSYGGSQLLELQISEGAPSDVFASADETQMRELVEAGRAEPSQTFARNELVIVVPEDNPAHIGSLKDLPLAKRLVIGTPGVPVGAYTRQLLAAAGQSYGASFAQDVLARVVSEESNVRLVRAKVELGEADAAIVYRTDAASSQRTRQVAIPVELNVRARYPIAVLTRAPALALARRWVAYVLSPAGQATLSEHGFLVGP